MPETLGSTPSQTVGPFLHIILPWPDGSDVVAEGTPGAVILAGTLTDGKGEVVPDGLIETWQLEPSGFGRCPTAADGTYWFRLVPPATGYVDVSVFARGLLDRVVTRAYFGPVDLPDCEALQVVEESPGRYRFDICLQGANETPFFAP